MAININSEAYCRKAYLNYHCYGNTMGISSEDMGKITQAWESKISSWQATVSSDENEYEFDDSDYSNYKDEGRDAAKDATGGYDGKNSMVDTGSNVVLALGGTASTIGAIGSWAGKGLAKILTGEAVGAAAEKTVEAGVKKGVEEATKKAVEKAVEEAAEEAAKKAVEKASEEIVKEGVKEAVEGVAEEAIKEGVKEGVKESLKSGATVVLSEKTMEKIGETAAEKGAKEAAKQATKETAKTFSAYVSAAFAIATALKYWIGRPNREDVKAANALQAEMAGAQATLGETQSEMEVMSEEIISLSDEANMTNEDTNDEIEEQKTEYDMYYATCMSIQEKLESGEPLTESEKQLYKEVVGYLEEIGTVIQDLADDTTDVVSDLYNEIGTYQEGYDVAAETMGEIEGLTDYAESFDTATQIMCYVEGGVQTLNVATAGKAAARLFAGPWWNWAIAIAATAAGTSSGIAAAEQFKWAGDVGTEIELRKTTQDINSETLDIYTEEIDAYDGFMQGVEDLELEIPDDIEAPEELNPDANEDPNGIASTEYTDYTEILKEVEEGSKVLTENNDGTGKVVIAQQYGTAIAMALGLPEVNTGEKFGQEAIPAIIAQLVPGYSSEDILKVMNGGTLQSSYNADLTQTITGEDTGADATIDNSDTLTENLKTIINFYKPIFLKASQQGWKC